MEGWFLTSDRPRSRELYKRWPEGTKHQSQQCGVVSGRRIHWTGLPSPSHQTLCACAKAGLVISSFKFNNNFLDNSKLIYVFPWSRAQGFLIIFLGKLNREMLYPAKLSCSC